MRRKFNALTTLVAGAALVLGVSSCGRNTPVVPAETGVAPAPTFSLLQAGPGRMLHYLIDSKTEYGNTLKADVSLYQSGRVVVTAETTPVTVNPTAVITLRLTNVDQDTLWQTTIRSRFCEGASCARGTRRQTWTFEVGPQLAAQVSNVWMPLDIVR